MQGGPSCYWLYSKCHLREDTFVQRPFCSCAVSRRGRCTLAGVSVTCAGSERDIPSLLRPDGE